MLHTAIGEDRFRTCLGGFLKLNRFKTAEPLDLWNICTKKANGAKNIKVSYIFLITRNEIKKNNY